MAIFPFLPGILVCIIDSSGKPFDEYEDPDENEVLEEEQTGSSGAKAESFLSNGRTEKVYKYVECSTGQKFGIRCEVGKSYVPNCQSMIAHVYIDGSNMCGSIFSFLEGFLHEKSVDMTGARIGQGKEERLFQFGELKTTSDDRSKLTAAEMQKISDTGQITVELWRGGLAKKIRNHVPTPKSLNESLEVDEKALKGTAKTHAALLGESRRLQGKLQFHTAEYLDKVPIAKITFKYRSKEALKQLMVIPRTPSPEPAPELLEHQELELPGTTQEPARRVTMDDLDENARQRVEEFMQTLVTDGTSRKVKSENATAKIKTGRSRGDTTIKRERDETSTRNSATNKRVKNSEKTTFIDLTAD